MSAYDLSGPFGLSVSDSNFVCSCFSNPLAPGYRISRASEVWSYVWSCRSSENFGGIPDGFRRKYKRLHESQKELLKDRLNSFLELLESGMAYKHSQEESLLIVPSWDSPFSNAEAEWIVSALDGIDFSPKTIPEKLKAASQWIEPPNQAMLSTVKVLDSEQLHQLYARVQDFWDVGTGKLPSNSQRLQDCLLVSID